MAGRQTRVFTRQVAAVVLAAAGCVSSVVPPAAASEPALPAAQIETLVAGPTPLRMTGTLQSYDAEARQVAVVTTAGSQHLLMTGDSRIRQGGRVVDVGQLRSRIGATVIVRYVEAARGRVVVSLTVVEHGGGSPASRQK